MAEPISIQQLKDASLDVKSLEEAVNGDENVVVTTRLGETYPSLSNALNQIDSKLDSADTQINQGITNLFESGGLPAVPFATKALMTASVLDDGKYAMVTDDTEADNGLYVKTAGVWAKSAYDTVVTAKTYTDSLVARKELIGKYGSDVVELVFDKDSYITPEGTEIPSDAWTTSSKIPVKKGDIYVLCNDGIEVNPSSEIVNIFSFYDTTQEFSGSLHASRSTLSDLTDAELVRDLGFGDFFEVQDYFTYSVIVPTDGFIEVTTSKNLPSPNSIGYSKVEPILFKVSFDTYKNTSVKYCKKEALDSFEGVLHSVLSDKDIANNGKVSYTSIKSAANGGADFTYQLGLTSGKNIVSKRYSIEKGQYIHYCLDQYANLASIVFEDENGEYLGTQNIVTEYTTDGEKAGVAAFNIKSEYSGFFRLVYLSIRNSNALVGVTDNSVNYSRMTVENNTNDIIFHPCLGNTNTTVGNAYVANSYSNVFRYANTGNTTIANTISRPYFLPKGQVLRYELSCTAAPLLALVIQADTQLYGKELQSRAIYNVRYLPLISTSVYTEEHRLAWLNSDILNNTKQYLKPGEKGHIDYCNEDEDVLIVFLRPSKFFVQYEELKLQEDYKLTVFSKEEYIRLRNNELESQFKKITGYGLSGSINNLTLTGGTEVHKGLATYPPVLLFKGEVLNYATNFHGKSDVRNLNTSLLKKLKGEVYIDLSFSYSWTGSSDINFVPFWDRDISLDDKLSYRYNQILALETCIVYPGVSVKGTDGIKDVDVNGLIKNQYFKPRIVDLKDLVIGGNVQPLFSPLFTQSISYVKDAETGEVLSSSLNTSLSNSVDYITSFAPKNAYVEYSMWSHYTTINLWKNNTLGTNSSKPFPISQWSPELYFDDDENWRNQAGQPSLVTGATQLSEDSILLLNSKTATRSPVESIINFNKSETDRVIDTVLYPKQMENYRHELKSIDSSKYTNEYQVTDKTFLNIPIDSGIVFDLRTMSSVSLVDAIWGVLQIRQGEKVLAVLNVKTENQGQSSANYARKNVNLEFYNKDFEEVFIKFGDYIAQEEVVLKSYERSDRGHWRESTANRLWYQIRNAKPLPFGGVFPFDVYRDPNKPTNQKALGTPYAFPVEFHRGGEFWGTFSIRSKKKRENYCVEKKNPNHLLLQADRTLMTFSWANLELGMFELRNPSIKGYTEGDKNLPVGNELVEAKATRILDWLKGCYNGTIDIATTYQDYINLDSFLDYCLSIQYSYSWDSTRNNFLMGTYDGEIWYVFQYDSDHTFGGYSEVYSKPFSPFTINHSTIGDIFYRTITPTFADKIRSKYFDLRDKGIIDIENIQGMINESNNMLNAYARKKDLEYWGEFSPAQDVGSGMWWTAHRLNFLDAYYGYNEYGENMVVNTLFNPATIKGDSAETFTFEVDSISADDKLTYIIGADTKTLDIEVVYVSPTSVKVVIENNSDSNITVDASYLQIFKE